MNLTLQHLFVYGLTTGLFITTSFCFAIFAFVASFWHQKKSRGRILLYGAISMVGYALCNIYVMKTHVYNIEAIFPNWLLFLGKMSMPIALYLNTKIFIQAIPIQSINAFTFWHKIKPVYYLLDVVYIISFFSLIFITDDTVSVSILMALSITTSISGVIFASNALKRLGGVYKLLLPLLIIVQSTTIIISLSTDLMAVDDIIFVYLHLLNSVLTTVCLTFFISYISTHKDIANKTSMLSNTEELYTDILSAIKNDFLFLEYQPKIAITTGKVIGLEALVRLNHPKKGIIRPDQFIPVAEQSELINHITKWVINQVISDSKTLSEKGKTIPIAINFSVRDMKPEMVEYLVDRLHKQKVPQELITIEVTESLILDMTPEQQQALTMIKASKTNVSLDDFSAGFSSLRHIDELGLDELKIDKELTFKLLEKNKRTIVSMIVNMCHELDIKVVAEGVENDEILQVLKDIDCHIAQGYGICRPKRLEELMEWCKVEVKEISDGY